MMQARSAARSRPCAGAAGRPAAWASPTIRQRPGTAGAAPLLQARTRCRAAPPSVASASAAVQQLLDAAAGTERGVSTSPEARAQIFAAVEALKAAGAQSNTSDVVSGTWRLVWTTEKETLWIIKNAGLFGTKAGDVFQVVDTATNTLQNVITFPPNGAFIVDSGIKVEGPQRVSFKFTSAKLKRKGGDLKLPPFGQGWFDTVYCDGAIRVAQDIRGDTLVVAADGPPRRFE